jgi:ATP-binding cassette, subfamily B, bacterial MsbA
MSYAVPSIAKRDRVQQRQNALKTAKPTLSSDSSLMLMSRIWRDWLAKRWQVVLLSLISMALLAATSGAYSLIVKYIVDALNSGKPNPTMLRFVIFLIPVMTCSRALLLYLTNIFTNKMVNLIGLDMQKAGYAHLLAADYDRISRDTPGQLVSRLTNDVSAVQGAALALTTSSIRDTLTVFWVVVAMLYMDWQLTLLVLGVYPIAGWPILSISERLRKVAKRTQVELGGMTSQLIESLSGVRLIKTYRLEGYAETKTNASFEEIYKLRMKAARAKGSVDPLLEVLAGAALAGVTAFVGYRISSGVTTFGGFMGFMTALLLAAQPIRGFGSLPPRLQEGLAAAERFYEMLDEKPRIVDRPDARSLNVSKGRIQFERVTFAYGAEVPAIRDLTLDIPGGTTVALVGKSGAGKSTLMNLVPRLFEPQSGRILIDGQDVQSVTLESLREATAIVSQDITLFNDTVMKNIALGRLEANESDIRAAAASAACDFIETMPQKFETVIGDRGMRLSGGQRQRIALARAILRNAPILLLDEATSALDTQSERLVQEALARFSRGRTTLVIAHRLSTVQNADLICVMDEGTIIEQGAHAALMARGGMYALLVKQQWLGAEVGLGSEDLASAATNAAK